MPRSSFRDVMRYLFDHWTEVEAVLARGAVLLLDYDGTLTPIVARPELARLSQNMKDTLARASKNFPLGIISGRPLPEVERLVGLNGIYYAGNHGFEIKGPGVELVKTEAKRARPAIEKICDGLRERLKGVGEAIVEDKGLTASLHYRLVDPKNLELLKREFNQITKSHLASGAIRITHGKKVFEVRPNVEWDKGKAVLWILSVINPPEEVVPIYIGDNRTDEDAFLALKDKNGMTILVTEKPKESNARFFVKNVDEVKSFLAKLISLRGEK